MILFSRADELRWVVRVLWIAIGMLAAGWTCWLLFGIQGDAAPEWKPGTIIGPTTGTTSNATIAVCEKGRELVMRANGRPGCAADVTEPK